MLICRFDSVGVGRAEQNTTHGEEEYKSDEQRGATLKSDIGNAATPK